VLYCRTCLPKDPQSFRKRTQLAAAVQYYAFLRGGVDFSALIHIGRGDAAVANAGRGPSLFGPDREVGTDAEDDDPGS